MTQDNPFHAIGGHHSNCNIMNLFTYLCWRIFVDLTICCGSWGCFCFMFCCSLILLSLILFLKCISTFIRHYYWPRSPIMGISAISCQNIHHHSIWAYLFNLSSFWFSFSLILAALDLRAKSPLSCFSCMTLFLSSSSGHGCGCKKYIRAAQSIIRFLFICKEPC